jgi:FkbM family methyltransferase
MNSGIQNALLWCYARIRDTGILSTGAGRSLFEWAYLTYKSFEAGPVDGLAAFVQPGTLVIDVGANIGFFTRRFARWVGDEGGVIALEPEERNFARLVHLVRRARLQDRVETLKMAAAERDSTLFLAVNPHHPGDHHLATSGVPVPTAAVDTLLRERGSPPVSLIKIDVQGAEHRVLLGAAETLGRWRPALFVELDEQRLRENQSSVVAVAEFLATFGYRPFRLHRSGTEPEADLAARASEWRDRGGYADILFLAPLPERSLLAAQSVPPNPISH